MRGKESENPGRDLEILGRSRDVLLSVMGSHWRVSSREVKQSDLHFYMEILLATLLSLDYTRRWERRQSDQ